MSAFAGVLLSDKENVVDPSLMKIMESSLANTGRDGSFIRLLNSTGVVFRPFHTTIESHREQQPIVDQNFVFMFDGRIDNRGDLTHLFDLANPTDAELFVSTYKRYGNACFAKIIGEFAAAIVNIDSRELTLARDPFALRKLFYVRNEERIIWSTEIATLLNCPGVRDTVDEGFVAMSLAFLPEHNHTAFVDIKPVLPSHYMVFRGRRISSVHYWTISDCIRSVPKSQAVLCEELKHLLGRSLKANLRSDRTVTAELSGGLDSSTIVCLADYFSQFDSTLPQLKTLSVVYDKAQQSDERRFISAVEEYRGVSGFHIKEDDDPILSRWVDPYFISYPNRVLCFGGAVENVHKVMESLNSRVLLSGFFGDQLFISSYLQPYAAVDDLRGGRYLDAWTACRNWSLQNRQPLLQTIWHAAIRPTLPFRMRRIQTHSTYGPTISAASFRIPSWLDEQFVRRTGLRDRIHRVIEQDAELKAGSMGIRFANLMQAVGWFSSGYSQNRTTSKCIEMRYPYLYRPLVDFLISVPYNEHCSHYSARALHRATIEGFVPESVRTRTDKAGPEQALLLAASREKRTLCALVEQSRACARGFVNKTELMKEIQRWTMGQRPADMPKFIAVEMWLRALELRSGNTQQLAGILPEAWICRLSSADDQRMTGSSYETNRFRSQ